MRASRQSRGNALLITVVALAVLMVLVVGAIRFTGTNRVAAGSKLRGDQVAACADMARRTLLSRLAMGGIKVMDLKLSETIPDDPDPAHQSSISLAHYDGASSSTIVKISSMASANSVRGLTNVLPSTGSLKGEFFRVVVLCREAPPFTREAEIEFVFRYGF